MQTHSPDRPFHSTTMPLSDSGLTCPCCHKPMTLRQVSFTARRKDLTFVCLVCAWRTAKSSDTFRADRSLMTGECVLCGEC